ncbi:MAG: DUF192 domain-containing protein [Planctomycetota bacterium]
MADQLNNPAVARSGLAVWLGLMVFCIGGCTEVPEPAQSDDGTSRRAGVSYQEIEIAGQRFDLELAVNPGQRYLGLSGRQSIADDGGMLFVFPRVSVREFVMRDCVIPIDIIFVDDAGKVVAIHAMQVEPLETRSNPTRRYSSVEPVRFAIELRGGRIAELGVSIGDQIELPTASLKARAR